MTEPLWTNVEADTATNGHSTAAWAAGGVSLDSRTLSRGDLFVAIQGPNHDGHAFVPAALRNGAAVAMVRCDKAVASSDVHSPLLQVDDTDAGLRTLAKAARQRSNAQIVAITGSVGKTSTKEALAHALSASAPTHATVGNLNNAWGLPLSLARLPRDTAFAVFEIGMNQPGEIAPLSHLIRPHMAIITAIAAAHLESFTDLDGIAAEKANICAGLEPGGIVILPRDSAQFQTLRAKAKALDARILTFGRHDCADSRLLSWLATADGSVLEASILGQPLACQLAVGGEPWARNIVAVLTAVAALDLDLDRASKALSTLKPLPGRGETFSAPVRGGTVTFIDDAYNANPESVQAALQAIGATTPGASGRRIAVLGDMLELGETAVALHVALADTVATAGLDLIFTIGPLAAELYAVLPSEIQGLSVASADALPDALDQLLRPGDIVLVKGSKASKASHVVEHFRRRAARAAAKGGIAHAV
jgi:UDP-N-acetylmuramoyl-tripeptide--D-alanyl-D-alanine ligase